jgi:hypothetical protein
VTSPSVTITSATPTGFGQRIASYHLPGQATAQLLVADPSATVGDRAGAGTVSLFSLVGLNVKGVTTELPSARAIVTLFDSNTDSDPGVFGSNLGGLTFNTGLCVPGGAFQLVPWASNNIDVLTFFAYPNGPKDPRCFALKP